ncbi:MAG: DUF3489 domain-containing protein [Alsobacter sp.]
MTATAPKTYSTKSNARAGAKAAGIDLAKVDFIQDEEGRWHISLLNGEDADAQNGTKATLDSPIADQIRAASAKAPADPVADLEVTGDREATVETTFRAYLTADERSDAFMRSLFTQAFLCGQEAARAEAKAQRAAKPARERKPRESGPTKRELAAALLTRPEGTTTREILDATGWPAVSVPSIAKASGLSLRQTKDGKVTRYFGVPLTAAV